MYIIETNDYKKELLQDAFPIGRGTTAICYLRSDGYIFKRFIDTYLTYEMFNKHDMKEKFELINRIQNDSFIGPDILVMQDNKIVGYLYPYINANTFGSVSSSTTLFDLYKNIDKLVEDTIEISKHGFVLGDLHKKNVLFDGDYYVIDLDKGYKLDNIDYVTNLNLNLIYETIFFHIFKIKPWQAIKFNNRRVNEFFYNTSWHNMEDIYETFETYAKIVNKPNPTVRDLRRIPHIKERNSYYKDI